MTFFIYTIWKGRGLSTNLGTWCNLSPIYSDLAISVPSFQLNPVSRNRRQFINLIVPTVKVSIAINYAVYTGCTCINCLYYCLNTIKAHFYSLKTFLFSVYQVGTENIDSDHRHKSVTILRIEW